MAHAPEDVHPADPVRVHRPDDRHARERGIFRNGKAFLCLGTVHRTRDKRHGHADPAPMLYGTDGGISGISYRRLVLHRKDREAELARRTALVRYRQRDKLRAFPCRVHRRDLFLSCGMELSVERFLYKVHSGISGQGGGFCQQPFSEEPV